jgi:hypothetical protein
MQRIPQQRLVLAALIASIALNGAMILMSVLAGVPGVGAFPLRISDAIAAPPGLIVKWVFQPHEHSVGAFVVAAVESLIFSVFFYVIAALLVLEAVGWLRPGWLTWTKEPQAPRR